MLFVTHNGLTEPLGRRQVLPYLVGLSKRGWQFQVLSFEKPATASASAVEAVQDITTRASILWQPLRYHQRPAVVSTAWDMVAGAVQVRRLAGRVSLVHARSTVPAAMVRAGARRAPWVFDVRGLLGDEYADAQHWRRGGVRQRTTSAVERALIAHADGLVMLTRRVAASFPDREPTVIPCCVDLDAFRPDRAWRAEARRSLGWTDEPLLVYAGSLGSWYRLDHMLAFVRVARAFIRDLRFLLLTPTPEAAGRPIADSGLQPVVQCRAASPDEVPRYLAAADAGICFLGEHASKRASSPTKFGEYLASGLPVVTNPWVGDAADLAGNPAWLIVDAFGEESFADAARALAALLGEREAAAAAARGLAQREFSLDTALDRYDALYRSVLTRRGKRS